ncbi:MAG: tRNA lysidine(34) synthetase TilS [Flavobacteriaceae bacterium]
MLERFKHHITNKLPFLNNAKLLVAISGGIDSVVLAHLCHQLELNFSLAHCNFKLRYADSDKDAIFVKNLAEFLQVEMHSIEFDTVSYSEEKKMSTQMAARELRYNWFEKLTVDNAYDYILTAHHTNDNIETVIINLTRGASLHGLTGVPEINGNVIRPLLPFTREEIEQFTITQNITWREDESNQSTKYVRNKVRHKVVPVLEELNTSFPATFNKHLAYLKKERKVLTQHLDTIKKEVCIFDESFKIDLKKLLKYEDVDVYLRHILNDYNFTQWSDITDLCTAQSGKYVHSDTHRLIKDRDFLLLEKKKKNSDTVIYKITEDLCDIDSPLKLEFNKVHEVGTNSVDTIYIDKALVVYPLILRKKHDGDVFYPFGMKGKKKLSKYFKDEKMSLLEKEHSWLLCDATDSIIWIVGRRADNRFCVGKTTENILKITRR